MELKPGYINKKINGNPLPDRKTIHTTQSNSGCQFTNSRGTTSGKILVAKKSSNNEEMNKQIILIPEYSHGTKLFSIQ